jgi:hypothetical protein
MLMHGHMSPAFSRNEHVGYTAGEHEIDGDARCRLDGPGSCLTSDWRSADARAARADFMYRSLLQNPRQPPT